MLPRTTVVLVLTASLVLCEAFSKESNLQHFLRSRGKGKGNHGGHSGGSSEEKPRICNGRNCNEGDEVMIHCDADKVIKIVDAVYGNQFSGCGDPSALAKVAQLCNGASQCSFTVDGTVFDESTCSAVIKEKLNLNYVCLAPCKGFYCANGGVCIVTPDVTAACNCTGDWTGDRCDDNSCIGVNCNHGICLVNPANGTSGCYCDRGFTGSECNDCDLTVMIAGDGLDNDCDGMIDNIDCRSTPGPDCFDVCVVDANACAAGETCNSLPDGTFQCV